MYAIRLRKDKFGTAEDKQQFIRKEILQKLFGSNDESNFGKTLIKYKNQLLSLDTYRSKDITVYIFENWYDSTFYTVMVQPKSYAAEDLIDELQCGLAYLTEVQSITLQEPDFTLK